MPLPLIGGGIKRWCCLTSVGLSRTSGLSREQRHSKTKIGTEVARRRHTWLGHHFQCQRSKSPGRFTHRGVFALGSCSGDRGKVGLFTVGTGSFRSGAVGSAARGASAPTERREGRGHIVAAPRTACLQFNSLHINQFRDHFFSFSSCVRNFFVLYTPVSLRSKL